MGETVLASSALIERVDLLAQRALDGAGAQGLAIGVSERDGSRLIRAAGYANRDAGLPVTEESLFEIGSISKSVLAIVCMQLVAEGKLDLHVPVTEYLPWFSVQSTFAPITAHHLLTHTSGLPGGHTHRPHAPHEVWELRNVRLIAEPGAVWEYSNVGYDALGLMVEEIIGQSFEQFMRERVFEPLGLTSSYAVVTSALRPRLAVGYLARFDDRPVLPRHGVEPATWLETAVGSGSIVMNASDLLAYAEFLLQTWNGEDSPVLTSAQLHTMLDPTAVPKAAQDATYGYGLAWDTDPEQPECVTRFGHSGGMVGYTTDLGVDLESGRCVVWLANGNLNSRGLTGALGATIAAAHEGALPELPAPSDPFVFENGAELAGIWHGDGRTIEIVANGDGLELLHGDERTRLQRHGRSGVELLADHPAWELFAFDIVRASPGEEGQPGPVSKLHHGGETFYRDGAAIPEMPTYPPEWDRYVGHYRAYNPWGSNFRIVVREGQLLLIDGAGWTMPLAPEGDGFRVGEAPQNLDFLRFDAIVGDTALVARAETGAEFSRFFTP